MFTHYSAEKWNIRWWLHAGQRSCLGLEFSWRWRLRAGLTVGVDQERWYLWWSFFPLFVSVSLSDFGLWRPMRWSDYVSDWLPDERNFSVSFDDWSLRLEPWGRSMEWRKTDPWWVRGVRFDFRSLLGRQRYRSEILVADAPVAIEMPEGTYHGTLKVERQTWKRPLWFRRTRLSTWIDVPRGIPFSGKGENSWDCGDDGLFGCGVDGVSAEKAIEHFRSTVLKNRARYGRPSDESIREALA